VTNTCGAICCFLLFLFSLHVYPSVTRWIMKSEHALGSVSYALMLSTTPTVLGRHLGQHPRQRAPTICTTTTPPSHTYTHDISYTPKSGATPKTVVSSPKTVVSSPKTVVSSPKTVVSSPKTVVSSPKTVVSHQGLIMRYHP
jgi:hypothetical protein